jgi:molybdopterin/thiamine biosynthesis adenylyltransferase
VKNVVIVGVGALGSHVVQFLRSVNCQIKVIDFDRVEKKNTLAQFHGNPSVGKSKVQALQQSMKFMWGMKIDGVPHRLKDDNVRELLGSADLVIDCLDNAASRYLVMDFVRERGISCLHGCLAATGDFGRVVWDENFEVDSETEEGGATCEDGEHLPFIGMVSACLARSAQSYLENHEKVGFNIHPGGTTRI